MIYLIIPPFLVVLSIVGIILFLMKKAPEVQRMVNEEKLAELERGEHMGYNKEAVEDISSFGSKAKNIGLIILEKITRKFRVIFLKLENRLTTLAEAIKRKRNERAEIERISKPPVERDASDGVTARTDELAKPRAGIKQMLRMRQARSVEELEGKYFRPIISDRIVVPKRRREVKEHLEEILIERIAVNPKDVEAYERLGEYYFEIKNFEHAKVCFKQVIKLNPLNRSVRYKMKRLEKLLGDQ